MVDQVENIVVIIVGLVLRLLLLSCSCGLLNFANFFVDELLLSLLVGRPREEPRHAGAHRDHWVGGGLAKVHNVVVD